MRPFHQIITFFGVGVVATVADWGTTFVLTRLAGVNPVVAALIAYCVGGLVSYVLNRSHTFETDRTHLQAGSRFAAVMVIGFSLTGLFMWLFAERLGLDPMISRVISTGLVFFWNFVAHKLWTFGEKRV